MRLPPSLLVVLFMPASASPSLRSKLIHPTTVESTTRNESGSLQQPADVPFDPDEMIIMHMERDWGMREMHRYREHHGTWPLKSELPGYDNEDDDDPDEEEEEDEDEESSSDNNTRGSQRPQHQQQPSHSNHIFTDTEDNEEGQTVMANFWDYLPTHI